LLKTTIWFCGGVDEFIIPPLAFAEVIIHQCFLFKELRVSRPTTNLTLLGGIVLLGTENVYGQLQLKQQLMSL
jgi:hypothetical protein